MELFDSNFWELLITVLSPVIIAMLGIWHYRKQRVYENVQKRYLIEGFDMLIGDYENAMGSYRHNWQLSIYMLNQVRDYSKDLISKKAMEGYFGLGKMVLPTIAVHRVNNLLKSKKIWEMHQALFAFTQDTYYKFLYDFKIAVNHYIDNPKNEVVTKENIYENYFSLFQEMNQNSKKYDQFLGYIKDIASVFEKNNHSNKTLSKFKDRADIIEIIKKMDSIEIK